MTRWTSKQVRELAPDTASLNAARKLAVAGPWSDTGANETLLWGRCQGSGKTPYQVSIDLTGPAFRCSCPSRKFPCKHALALMLLWADGRSTIPDATEPAPHAGDWAAQRTAKAAAQPKAQRKPPDPVARAKRLEDRLALMDAGMADFALWLGDLMRGGVAAARQQPYTWWDTTAARLVDAQLPGLAEQVRTVASDVRSREDWADHLLAVVGRWWTATHCWAARESLTIDEVADLRAYIGWPFATDEIKAADTVPDRWLVLGVHHSDDGRLQQRRTWLWGETTHQTLQVLDFAAGGPLPVPHTVGSALEATVARYPGTTSRRALLVDDPVPAGDVGGLPAGGNIDGALRAAAETWGRNPWASRVPVILTDVRLSTTHVVDTGDRSLPLLREVEPWLALAVSGGAPVTIFAELEDRGLRPLSVEADAELVAL